MDDFSYILFLFTVYGLQFTDDYIYRLIPDSDFTG
jgi:hypothetical protein